MSGKSKRIEDKSFSILRTKNVIILMWNSIASLDQYLSGEDRFVVAFILSFILKCIFLWGNEKRLWFLHYFNWCSYLRPDPDDTKFENYVIVGATEVLILNSFIDGCKHITYIQMTFTKPSNIKLHFIFQQFYR